MEYKLRYWLPLACVITATFISVHVITQQMLRHDANDPQIQMSEDIAQTLADGKNLNDLLPVSIDLKTSIAPFVIMYDKDGNVVSSTATLNGQTPELPRGVLAFAKEHKQDRLTWQPETEVREAAVVTYYNGKNSGYVLVGRSLREVEVREDHILKLAEFGWLITFVGSFVASFLFIKSPSKK